MVAPAVVHVARSSPWEHAVQSLQEVQLYRQRHAHLSGMPQLNTGQRTRQRWSHAAQVHSRAGLKGNAWSNAPRMRPASSNKQYLECLLQAKPAEVPKAATQDDQLGPAVWHICGQPTNHHHGAGPCLIQNALNIKMMRQKAAAWSTQPLGQYRLPIGLCYGPLLQHWPCSTTCAPRARLHKAWINRDHTDASMVWPQW